MQSGDGFINIGGRLVGVSKLVSRPQIGGKMTLPPKPPPQENIRRVEPIPEEPEEPEEMTLSQIINEKPSKKIVRDYFRDKVAELEEAEEEI